MPLLPGVNNPNRSATTALVRMHDCFRAGVRETGARKRRMCLMLGPQPRVATESLHGRLNCTPAAATGSRSSPCCCHLLC